MVWAAVHQGKITGSQHIALVLKVRFVAVPFEI
jgi:hypothetical protein